MIFVGDLIDTFASECNEQIGNKTISNDAKFIDNLFGYKKSIKEISQSWGWLSLYQKHVQCLKSYAQVKFSTIKEFNVDGKKVRVYLV